MNDTGTYEEREFPTFRNPTIDTLNQGLKKHHVPFLFEVDVTEGRKSLNELKASNGEAISFTGWAKNQWAEQLIVAENSKAEDVFRTQAQKFGFSVRIVSLSELEPIVSPLKESFASAFMGNVTYI